MMLFLNLLTVALLALVAGLLLAVGQQVRVWRQTASQSPLLAEQLATQLLAARQGLEDMRKEIIRFGPDLERLLSDGGKLRTELQFLLERADQSAARLDMKTSKKTERAAPEAPQLPLTQSATIEQVAGANGKAVQASHLSSDPLEELLAGLQQPAVPTKASAAAAKSSRRGPVTAAELALAQRLGETLSKGA